MKISDHLAGVSAVLPTQKQDKKYLEQTAGKPQLHVIANETSGQSNLTTGRIAAVHGRYSLYFTTGCPFPAQTCPFPQGNPDPHLIHGSLSPPKSLTQMAP